MSAPHAPGRPTRGCSLGYRVEVGHEPRKRWHLRLPTLHCLHLPTHDMNDPVTHLGAKRADKHRRFQASSCPNGCSKRGLEPQLEASASAAIGESPGTCKAAAPLAPRDIAPSVTALL